MSPSTDLRPCFRCSEPFEKTGNWLWCEACRNPRKSDRTYQRQAHHAVERAVGRGDLVRPRMCESCGRDGRIEGAHYTYRPKDWLRVRWLCVACHRRFDGN